MSAFVHWLPYLIASALTFGGLVYYVIACVCVWQLRQRQDADSAPLNGWPPFSLLKPLCGAEPELEACLRSFFVQDYPAYEILFAVRNEADPAVDVVNRMRSQ